MELFSLFKVLVAIGVLVGIYAIVRNLDIIKIILIYWKDLIFGRK